MNSRQLEFYNKIKNLCEEHGSKLISKEYVSYYTKLEITCCQCGKVNQVAPYTIFNENYKFRCRQCIADNKKPSLSLIASLMEKKGAKLLSTTYTNANDNNLKFSCSRCGKEGSISWHMIQQGVNKNFLCHSCQSNCRTSPEVVKKYFEDHGVELLNTYKNNKTPLEFRCTSCGKLWKIGWQKVCAGENKRFLCGDCNKYSPVDYKRVQKFNELKILVESKGAKLISEEKVDYHEAIKFYCSICGTPYHIRWSEYVKGVNPNFLCYGCLHGIRSKPENPYGNSRHLNDNFWLYAVKKFFNIPKDIQKQFSSHHILKFSCYPDYRTSLCNGYPLYSEYHSNKFSLNDCGDPFHRDFEFENPENWPEVVKLPYHNYSNFRFLNLNSVMITEILYKYSDMNDLYKKKCNFAKDGKLYIPIFYPEIFNKVKQEIIFSMIRNRLWKYFPDIYSYTGQEFTKVYARKLKVVQLTFNQAEHFFAHNHIQGFLKSSIYLGLVDASGEIYQAMSFGPSREKLAEVEMYRLATKCNSFVVGGASKLFAYYVNNFRPNSIVSFCDVRFSSIDPNETIYVKQLGFEYVSYSKPNYKWLEPNMNLLFSRQAFQKHLLKDKLANFDPNLSETQNMVNAGYVKLYDCGNFKFIWRKDFLEETDV